VIDSEETVRCCQGTRPLVKFLQALARVTGFKALVRDALDYADVVLHAEQVMRDSLN
jgi:hypothetical protein